MFRVWGLRGLSVGCCVSVSVKMIAGRRLARLASGGKQAVGVLRFRVQGCARPACG